MGLTVGELRRALEGVPDHIDVMVIVANWTYLPESETYVENPSDFRNANRARNEFNRVVIE